MNAGLGLFSLKELACFPDSNVADKEESAVSSNLLLQHTHCTDAPVFLLSKLLT